MDEGIIHTISVFQKKLEKYAPVGDSNKLLYYLSKLKHLPIKVLHLEKTGVGISVNRLRHFPEGVGDRARSLVAVWKKIVAADVGEDNPADRSKRSSSVESGTASQELQSYPAAPDDEDEDEAPLQIEVAEDPNGDEPGDGPVLPDLQRSPQTREVEEMSNDVQEAHEQEDYSRALSSDYDPSVPLNLPSHSNGDSQTYGKYNEVALSDSDHGPAGYNPLTSMQDYGDVGTSNTGVYEPTPTASSHGAEHLEEGASASTSSHSHKKNKHKHSRSKDKKHKSHSKDKSSKSKHKSKNSDSVKEKTHKDKRKEDERSSRKRSREEPSTVVNSEQSLDRRRAKAHKISVPDDSHSLVQCSEGSPRDSPECDIVYNGHSSLPDVKSAKDSDQEPTTSSRHKSHERHSSSHSSKNHHKKSRKDRHHDESSTSVKRKKLESDEGFGAALMGVDSCDLASKKKKSKSSHHKEKDEKRDKNHKSKSSHKDKRKSSSSNSRAEHQSGQSPSLSSPVAASSASVPSPPSEAAPALPVASAALLDPNYKPLPHLALPDIDNDIDEYPTFDQPSTMNRYSAEDLAMEVMTSKKSRRQIYSGRSKLTEVPSLFEIATRCLQENIDSLEYTGGVPFEVIKPVIEKATAKQLFNLEHHNPYLLDSTSHIWEQHCKRDFKNCKPKEMETFRDMHIRLMDERREKLKNVQRKVMQKREKEQAKRCTAILAYKGVVPKPPPNVSRAQAKFGTGAVVGAPQSKTKADEVKARKVALANAQRAERSGAGPNARPGANKKPKAPLMAKTMQFYKKTFRR